MSPKQTTFYWREWAAVRRSNPTADRYALHLSALGKNKSSKDFTNADFDKVLATFRAISRPDDLNGQLRQANMGKIRLHTAIEKQITELASLQPHCPRSDSENYVLQICRNKFGHYEIARLTEEDLTDLRNTLAARLCTKRRKARSENPNGVQSLSPGLIRSDESTLGSPSNKIPNPEGVESSAELVPAGHEENKNPY